MSKEINSEPVTKGEFKFWTKHTDKKIDELASIVSDGFTMMEARLNERFEQIDQRFEQIESRLRHIDARLNMLGIDVADLRSM